MATWLHESHPGPLYVTENGTANSDDGFRSRFIHEQLAEIAKSDLPIERYYHWSFIDNWEWLEGESARFDLISGQRPISTTRAKTPSVTDQPSHTSLWWPPSSRSA